MQLELLPATPPAPVVVYLNDILHGNCVRVNGRILMRVKPTGFLLNSTIITDVLNRGACVVVDMQKGTLYCMRGTTLVTRISSKLVCSKLQGEE